MDMEKKRFSLSLGALGAAAIIGSTGINVFANDTKPYASTPILLVT